MEHFLVFNQSQNFLTKDVHLRRLPKPHSVVALTHNLFARSIQKLGKPADTTHKKAGVDVEQYDGWVAVRVLPVGKKCGLKGAEIWKFRAFKRDVSCDQSL